MQYESSAVLHYFHSAFGDLLSPVITMTPYLLVITDWFDCTFRSMLTILREIEQYLIFTLMVPNRAPVKC